MSETTTREMNLIKLRQLIYQFSRYEVVLYLKYMILTPHIYYLSLIIRFQHSRLLKCSLKLVLLFCSIVILKI